MKLRSRNSSEICMRNKSTSFFKTILNVSVVTLTLLGLQFAQTDYYRHTVFDNSITPDFYYYSGAGEVSRAVLKKSTNASP